MGTYGCWIDSGQISARVIHTPRPDWMAQGVDFLSLRSQESILTFKGLLTCLDGYMNVALEGAEEWAGGRMTARYGDCFLRGNNGVYLPRSCHERILILSVLYISALEDL